MRIANVAVSVPLPGISPGRSYVHPVWGITTMPADTDSEDLQAGSLDREILLLCRNGCILHHQFVHPPAMRFYAR
jgi:hypothetical protein